MLHGSSTYSQTGCPCMPYTVGSSVWGWGFKGRWCSKSRKGFLDAWRNAVLKATSGNRSPAPLSMQIRKLDPECWPLVSGSSFGPVCRSRIKIMLFEFWAVKLQSGCDSVVPSVTYSGWMWHRCQLDLNPPLVPWRASSMLGFVDYAGLGLLSECMRGSFQRYHKVGSCCFNFAKRCATEKSLGTSWNKRLSFHKLCDHWFLC